MTDEERILLMTLARIALVVFEKQGATETAALLRANIAAVEDQHGQVNDLILARRLHRTQ